MTNPELKLKDFITNVDYWIKEIRKEVSKLSDIPNIVFESIDNIQHNYELIYQVKDEIEELKNEMDIMRILIFTLLRKSHTHKIRNVVKKR